MRLRFGPYRRDDEESPRPRARRAPPDYTSRGVRFRLWILVGMAVLVLTLMAEARNPKYYAWMWKNEPPAASQPKATKTVGQSKVPARVKLPIPIAAEKIPGAHRSDEKKAGTLLWPTGTTKEEATKAERDQLLARALEEGWLRVFEHLPADDREPGHNLLFALLRSARAGTEATEVERTKGEQLLPQLDEAWAAYREDAKNAIDALPANEQRAWQSVIDDLERNWTQKTLPALQALVTGRKPDDRQHSELDKLQEVLDELALDAVQDNTVPNRAAERHAWFRLFEVLGGTEEPVLRQLSHGPVGYVQLLKQPKDYRGKLVTVKGTVELGYRITAPENVEGLQQYYIFWMRPAGGDDSPIVIYALETPPGFPPVLDKDEQHQVTNRLQVEAEFTGYFFKRMAYRSTKDTRTTPLILARGPRFDERRLAASAVRPIGHLPSPLVLTLILGSATGIALVVAAFAYNTTRRTKQDLQFPAEIPAAELGRLEALAGEAQAAAAKNREASPGRVNVSKFD